MRVIPGSPSSSNYKNGNQGENFPKLSRCFRADAPRSGSQLESFLKGCPVELENITCFSSSSEILPGTPGVVRGKTDGKRAHVRFPSQGHATGDDPRASASGNHADCPIITPQSDDYWSDVKEASGLKARSRLSTFLHTTTLQNPSHSYTKIGGKSRS
jgi:hypothetical protein